MSTGNSFHVTVGVSPTHSIGGISLEDELRLLKSALLYADQVNFYSLSSSFLIAVLQLSELSGDDILRIFSKGLDNPELDQILVVYEQLKSKKRRRQEIIAFKRMDAMLDKFRVDAREHFQNIAMKAGIDELAQAVESGLVNVQVFDGKDNETLVRQYFDAVSNAVMSGDTYPLFDDLTGRLIQYAIKEGKLNPSNVHLERAKHVGLSSDLLQRLPLFDNARLDVVLDVRKELDRPLRSFRSAIVKFSREVENEAWNSDFALEAERVFIEHIEPAILEIEEQCKSNKFLFSLLPNLVDKPAMPLTTSGLGLLLAQASQLPSLVAMGLAAGAGTATVTLRTLQEWQEKKRIIESNQLYFYYHAGQKFKS